MINERYSSVDCYDYKGHPVGLDFDKVKQKIRLFDVRDDDVFITSYPKSGTTWCQEMVYLIENNLNYDMAKTELVLRFPWLEIHGFSESILNFGIQHNLLHTSKIYKYIENIEDPIITLNNSKSKRLIKTHLPWNLLPQQISQGEKSPKIIHILRNPLQVAASQYYFVTNLLPIFRGSLDDFVDLFIKGKILGGRYFNTVKSYWNQRHLPNVLIITYEEMSRDLRGVIAKVSDFLGKTYSEDEITKLEKHLSFEEMEKNKSVNREEHLPKGVRFMRNGKTDSYKEELSDELIEKLEEWVQENVKGTQMPYENNSN